MKTHANDAAPALPAPDLTPETLDRLVAEAHQARAEALARMLRSLIDLTGDRPHGRAQAAIGVPEVIVRAGKVRPYLMADAMVSSVFDLAAFVGRLFRGGEADAAAVAGGLPRPLGQPLASIRTLAEVLRDNPPLAPEQRNLMPHLIVDQSDRHGGAGGVPLNVAARR